jgi:hypothetical protein
MKLSFRLFWMLEIPIAAAHAQPVMFCDLTVAGSNEMVLMWETLPGKSYVIETTTNLAQPWQPLATVPATFTATSNWLSYALPLAGNPRFYRIAKLDTEPPEVWDFSPSDGGFAVPQRSTVQVRLKDESAIDPASITFTLDTNAPVTLADPRLTFTNGTLTYAPATNEVLGTLAQTLTNTLALADTRGNGLSNLTWSFQIELPTVLSSNIVFVGRDTGPGAKALGADPPLVLISTNGDLFTYRYSGASSGVSNGLQLVDADPCAGYTRTVTNFTDYPESNTVVVATRPTKLAELLQEGSLTSASFFQPCTAGRFARAAADEEPGPAFELRRTVDLARVLYQDTNFLVEVQAGSQLDLGVKLDLSANFHWWHLTAFEAKVTGNADFNLVFHAEAEHTWTYGNSFPLITPIRQVHLAFIGAVPVWVESVLEFNFGWSAELNARAEYTHGFRAAKELVFGRRWDAAGWHDIRWNPPLEFQVIGPVWQAEAGGKLHAYVQPKLTLYLYSAAGVSADLKPYLDLEGRVQLNPFFWELGLYGGITSTLGLDLRLWDDAWGELPSTTFDLIPRRTLWYRCGSVSNEPGLPEVTVAPEKQARHPGETASFEATVTGAEPLSYQWQRNGVDLTEGGRFSGTRSNVLQISEVGTNDVGRYRVLVRNAKGRATSPEASLSLVQVGNPTWVGHWPVHWPDSMTCLQVVGDCAYVGHSSAGLQILNISEPANPTLVTNYGGEGFDPRDVQVVGDYAYVIRGAQEKWFTILNVSDPANPVCVTNYGSPNSYPATVHVVGSYAYVGSLNWLHILNVGNPSNPVPVGDIYWSCGPDHPLPMGVQVEGSYAWVALNSDYCHGLQVLNISNPAKPLLVGSCDIRRAFGLQVEGIYAYVAGVNGFQIVDISDPANPLRVGGYGGPGGCYRSSVKIVGNYAFVGQGWGDPHCSGQLEIFNISDPANPVLVASHPITDWFHDIQVVGNLIFGIADPGFVILELPVIGP